MDEEVRAAALVACHGCGEVYRVPGLPEGGTAACTRCGGTLFRHRTASIERALALNVAAFALFGVANLYPLMTMTIAGREQATTLLEGSMALWRTHMEGLAALVFLVAILIPLLRILGSLWVLGLAQLGRLGRREAPVFRLIHLFHPWAMTEVYLLGLIVAWVKLKDLAQVHLGLGIVAFVGLIVVMVWAESALEPHEVWERVQPQLRAPAGGDLGDGDYLGCHACGQLVPGGDGHGPCPRCGAALHRRKPESLARTWALLAAAAILYVPANLLPIMTVTSRGQGEPDTILSGVKLMIAIGMWPVALLVFFASITVPILKVTGLVYLLVSVGRRSTRRRRDRTLMYRVIEQVGRWSMVDVFMISILTALVSLGELATIVPGKGAAAFAAVVILTMLASASFDPRLIWDAGSERDVDRAPA